MRASRMLPSLVILVLTIAGIGEVRAESAEVAGMITEIKPAGGRIEVKPSGTNDWRPVGPLMSLLTGDVVRANDGAMAVVLLSGGRGILRVEPGYPVTIPGPETTDSKARKVLSASFGFLSYRAREFPHVAIGTRSGARAPTVFSPRNSAALADRLTFEWLGPSGTYTVEIIGPEGPMLTLKNLPGKRVEYPSNAATLRPGVRYTVHLLSEQSQRADRAWFEILSPEETREVRENIASLDRELSGSIPPDTLAALRAGYLADRGLLHEAGRELIVALVQSPNEATLHFLLGNIYSQMGLPLEAAQAFDEARLLMGNRR